MSYLMTLPIQRKSYVVSKYIVSLLVALVCSAVISVAIVICHAMGMEGFEFEWSQLGGTLVIALIMTVVLTAIMVPIYIIFGGELRISAWYVPVVMFFKHIIFGGIEEIGWRYIFQPVLQERCNYIVATVITFVMWGMWHFSYFYIEGTLPQVQASAFLLGLLVNCFILSALFIVTKSLWICVMTHSLINVFTQLAMGGSQYVSYACRIIIIVTAVVLSIKEQKLSNTER